MQLEVYADHRWADNATERFSLFVHQRPSARICLPTGSTPRPLYTRVASAIDLSSATLFLLDEFDLPRESSARCDSMLERDLLGSLPKAPGAYHRLRTEAADPHTECARFDTLVGNGGLDVTLLGLGGNGHLGLNEPGAMADSPTRVVALTQETTRAAARYDADAAPLRGMTLGMRRILESKEIWLLVTGSHKAEILESVLAGPIGPDVPASYLRTHPNTTILADASAAAATR